MKKQLLAVATVVAFAGVAPLAQTKVSITSPADGSSVGQRPIVEGMVAEPKATVWVVVHPLEVSDYWVQPRLTVRETGSWKVQIHIGRPGRIDVGKLFEIRAVANPKMDLSEGLVLDRWPESAAMSELIEVRRK